MLQATWKWRNYPSMLLIAEPQLKKLFVMPKFRFILLDKPLYHELNLEKYTQVEYSKQKPHHVLFHQDLSITENHYEWVWYGTCNGGSAACYGPTFRFDPVVAADQTAFWLPLELFCCFPEKYKQYKKECTIGIQITQDEIPIKTKRIWMRKFIEALTTKIGK